MSCTNNNPDTSSRQPSKCAFLANVLFHTNYRGPNIYKLNMNVWQLRQVVLDKMALLGKLSPNSSVMLAYKEALPPLSQLLIRVGIGLMLGDVSLQANAAGTAYRIKFEWGDINKAYAFYVYSLFKLYCLSEPRKQVRVNKNGNKVTTWCFQTVTHPRFKVLADLFIVNGKKVVNTTLLFNVFTPVSLAFWFMDDGGSLSYTPNRYRLQLHTQGFSQREVESLAQLLIDKYGFDCWTKLNKQRWTLVISGHSYSTFFELVKPYIHDSMRRKLPQGSRTVFP